VSADRSRWREGFYLQIVDDTGDTVDLVADGARDILERRVSKLRRIDNSPMERDIIYRINFKGSIHFIKARKAIWSWTYREELVIKVEHLRTHEVLCLDSTENDDVAPNALVTKDTNTAVSIDSSESLGDLEKVRLCPFLMNPSTDLIVETSLLNLGDEDVVGLASNLNSLLGNITKNANGNTRAGEGVSVDKRLVDTELTANSLLDVSICENIIHATGFSLTLTSSLNRSRRGSISYDRIWLANLS